MITNRGNIRLFEPGRSTNVQWDDVYFPFASGRLTYDCVECNATCCRGHGYLVTVGPVLEAHVMKRAGLPLFVEATGPGMRQRRVANCPPACFFLTEQGLCDIHAAEGPSAKPETCRLFPFNSIRRFDRYLIVGPHLMLCPLRVASPGTHSANSDHGAILSAMAEQGISAHIPQFAAPHQDSAMVIQRERQIVLLSEACLDRGTYMDLFRSQLALDSPHTDTAQAHRALEQIVMQTHQLLGTPPLEALGKDRVLIQTLIALTPAIRSQLIFHRVHDPRRASRLTLPPDRIARGVLVVYLLAEAARHAGMTQVTLQTVFKLMSDFQCTVELLSYADAVVTWRRGIAFDVHDCDLALQNATIGFARALLPVTQRSNRRSLGDVLMTFAPSESAMRIAFLKHVAAMAAGRVVHEDKEGALVYASSLHSRIKNALNRWALARFDDAIILAASARSHRRATTRRHAPRIPSDEQRG